MSNLNIIFQLLHYEGAISNDPADACRIKNTNEDTDISAFSRFGDTIADLTVDQVIALPAADTDYLALFTDRDISIKLNGGSEVTTLSPRSPGVKTFVYFTKGSITGLTISNSSGSDAKVDIILANKA